MLQHLQTPAEAGAELQTDGKGDGRVCEAAGISDKDLRTLPKS